LDWDWDWDLARSPGVLPCRAGPYRSELTFGQDGPAKPFAMLEIGPAVVDTLARVKPASFAGDFGDYRPAHRQLIGIGDWVQIAPWEAGPGGLFSAPVVDRTNAGSRSATITDQAVARDQAITVPFAGRIFPAARRQRACVPPGKCQVGTEEQAL
jgi:hypothetical protein